MAKPQPSGRYSLPAIGLHWLIALLVAGIWIVGTWMVELPFSPIKLKVYSWHKWAGVTVFFLAIARLLWRLYRPPPPLENLPRWQIRAAHAAHGLLYVLLFVTPLSGWLFSSAAGFPTVWFGVLTLPDLVPKDAALKDIFRALHDGLNTVLAGLVGLHVVAALKHHWVDRDDTLARILPGLKPRRRPGAEV